jgi:PPK2 family polyphosphate:nucleotide phosphotransferase
LSALKKTLQALVVEPGTPARLDRRDPAWRGGPQFEHCSPNELDDAAKAALAESVAALETAQELLWAGGEHALLIVLQALDAAGKDGTIRHVLSGLNPQGVKVVSFKQPSPVELNHDFLWRVAAAVPERGQIGVFNRSHYEEVVAVRVHPEWLARQHLDRGSHPKKFWRHRYESINAFERHLDRNGTKVVKFFLHVSKEEQRKRLLARLDEPHKEWKFSAADIAERQHWDAYAEAFEEAISATSTDWAPWHVIPADHKPLMRALVAEVIVETMTSLDLHSPKVSDEQHAANEQARLTLTSEGRP